MDSETLGALRYWKTHRYMPDQIPFVEAVQSLSTLYPDIELRRSTVRSNEWVFYRVATDTPAIMTFAGVFSESDPYETGNFVWRDNEVPIGLDENRVRFAGYKAAYSYAIETYDDTEMWELQQMLEQHVVNVPGFNPSRKARLEWQNGSTMHPRFFIRVPMFFPFQGRGPQSVAPDGLHPWVKAAHARTRGYQANPRKPRVRAIEGGVVRPIEECTPNKLEYGDVVGLVFTVHYTENDRTWSPIYMMSDIIRVRRANREAYPIAPPPPPDDLPFDNGDFTVSGAPLGKQISPRSSYRLGR
ncbi:hypothetical protein L226DRAFT_459733 [Lentinus tigrinus ALCF2SS1-7]|uniref:uncharacterized protein n=1 Tax=Lentinus tigrinus ALCF2SS1-7 TaxID=1328758 RepID=UPI00116613D8|nr:hypothetical protein L226DRAFT_459733 [Lentinus tigrinus ALCF2SS1-7]